MKINCLGWYDRGNIGDESFKLALQRMLAGNTVAFTSKAVLPGFELLYGCGDIVKSYYLDSIPAGTKYNALGLGLGYESELELLKAKPPEVVYFRNKADVILAKNNGFNAKYTPDLAFYLDKPRPYEAPILQRKHPELKALGVFLTDNANLTAGNKDPKKGAYIDYFKWELATALEELSQWYEIFFIPLSDELYSYDLKMHMDVACRIPNFKGQIIRDTFNPIDTLRVIDELDLVASMKFHGLIFSTMMGTPFVNLGLTRKTQLFCEEQGISKLSIAPFSFTHENFMRTVKTAEETDIPQVLDAITTEKKVQLKEVEAAVLSWYE